MKMTTPTLMTPRSRHASLRSTLSTPLMSAGAAIAWTTSAWAAGGGEHGGGFKIFGGAESIGAPTGLIYILLNFFVLFLILNKILFKPLRLRNAAKHERIRTDLERATTARSEAEELVNRCKVRLDKVAIEVEEIRATAKRQAEDEAADILAKARDDAEKIRANAKASVERESLAARRRLEAEVSEHAIARAEASIRESFGADDQARMVDAYVSELGQMGVIGRSSDSNSAEGRVQ